MRETGSTARASWAELRITIAATPLDVLKQRLLEYSRSEPAEDKATRLYMRLIAEELQRAACRRFDEFYDRARANLHRLRADLDLVYRFPYPAKVELMPVAPRWH